MDLILEPTQYCAHLMRVALTHDYLVVRDSVADIWSITQDEIDKFWATTIALKRGTLEEELFALPYVQEANIEWFLHKRPLAVLWVPGSCPL